MQPDHVNVQINLTEYEASILVATLDSGITDDPDTARVLRDVIVGQLPAQWEMESRR